MSVLKQAGSAPIHNFSMPIRTFHGLQADVEMTHHTYKWMRKDMDENERN